MLDKYICYLQLYNVLNVQTILITQFYQIPEKQILVYDSDEARRVTGEACRLVILTWLNSFKVSFTLVSYFSTHNLIHMEMLSQEILPLKQ